MLYTHYITYCMCTYNGIDYDDRHHDNRKQRTEILGPSIIIVTSVLQLIRSYGDHRWVPREIGPLFIYKDKLNWTCHSPYTVLL